MNPKPISESDVRITEPQLRRLPGCLLVLMLVRFLAHMRTARLCAIAVSVWTATCSSPQAPRNEAGTSGRAPDPAAAIIDAVNEERESAGVSALRANERLRNAARLHADQVAVRGRLEHTLRGTRYPTVADRLAAVDYTWRAYGENLASGQRSASAAVASWMSSRSHRANILNATFTETGVAVAADGRGRLYYVQLFGRR